MEKLFRCEELCLIPTNSTRISFNCRFRKRGKCLGDKLKVFRVVWVKNPVVAFMLQECQRNLFFHRGWLALCVQLGRVSEWVVFIFRNCLRIEIVFCKTMKASQQGDLIVVF